jgi:uncharacterized protein YggE
VVAKPDVAQFSFSVRAEGADATEAQGKSATAINNVMSYLKENGVGEKDIKTEGYNLVPKYTFEQKPCAFGTYCQPGEQKQNGFEVFQTVTVKVRDITKAGAVLGGVGAKGATDISGLNFTVEDEEKAKSDARALAIEDAQKQAEELAKSLGVTIVKMTSYYEDTPAMPYYAGANMDMAMAKSESMPVPEVPVGESKTVSTVNLTYEIK